MKEYKMKEYKKYGWYSPKAKKLYLYKKPDGKKVWVSTVTSSLKNPYDSGMNYFKGTEKYVGVVTDFIKSKDNLIN